MMEALRATTAAPGAAADKMLCTVKKTAACKGCKPGSKAKRCKGCVVCARPPPPLDAAQRRRLARIRAAKAAAAARRRRAAAARAV